MKTAIICAPGMEECEGLVVMDLLRRSGLEVDLIGLEKEITSSHKLTFRTDKTIDEISESEYDCLVLPGGIPGTPNLEADRRVQKLIEEFHEKGKLIAAICAAPSILAHKGYLRNGHFTCHPGFESGMESTHEKCEQDGNIITARGLGADFEFASKIIENLLGRDQAEEILKKIQYK